MSNITVSPRHAPCAADVMALLQTAYPNSWERHLRNFLGDTDPADLSPAELTRFTDHVFWLVKQTGIKDPAAWIAFHRAQSEDMAPVASVELQAPVDGADDIPEQRNSVELEPVKSKVDPAKTSGEPSSTPSPTAVWLKKNVGVWRRIEDVQREAAPPAPPVESEIDLGAAPAGLNGQTSSRGVRDNGGDEDDVALVDTLAGDRSPRHEPTSLPTPVTATVENGTTKAELLRGAKVAMSEAEGPKTETTPLGAMDRKRGRSGGRQIKKQKLPAEVVKAGGMLSPERMRIVLDSLREYPILSNAASKAGIHRKTLAYWIKRSAAGDVGYDIKWQGVEWRFHELCEAAMQEAHDRVLAAIVTSAGLKDENGKPVPEAIFKQQNKMLRFLLVWLRPDKWGKHRKIDVPHNGGVLVVGPNKVNNGTATSVKARKWKAGWRMIQKTEV